MSLVLYGKNYVRKIHGLRERKVTFRMGENEKEIDWADKERTLTIYTKVKAIAGSFSMH